MPAQWQLIRWPLVGELNTKIADVNLIGPKLKSCRNAFIDQTSRLRKRRGLALLATTTIDNGTIDTPVALLKYKKSIVALAGPNTPNSFEWSSKTQRWAEHRQYVPGYTQSTQISSTVLGRVDNTAAVSQTGIWQCDSASTNGYTLYAQVETSDAPVVTTIRVTLVDRDGVVICHRLALKTVSGASTVGDFGARYTLRVVALGNVFYVVYNFEGIRRLCTWICDTTSAATITTAIGTDVAGPTNAVETVADLNAAPNAAAFDVVPSGANGIFVAYRMTGVTTIKMGFINNSGALVNTSTIATTGAPLAVGVSATGTAHGIVYINGNVVNDVYAVLRTWNGAVWATTSTSGTIHALAGNPVQNICCRWDSATVLRIWYTADQVISGNDSATHRVYQATYTTGGVSAIARVMRRSYLASRPQLAADGNLYIWIMQGYRGGATQSTQPSHYLVSSSTGATQNALWPVMTHINSGVAGITLLSVLTLTSLNVDPDGALASSLIFSGRGQPDSGPQNVGVKSVRWFLDTPAGQLRQNMRAVESGDSLIMGGGLVQEYDGDRWTQTGFLRTTEMDTVAFLPGVGGSMTSSTTYWYRIVEEWTNSRGKREQGFDSGPVLVTMAVGKSSVSINIPTQQMTYKYIEDNVVSTFNKMSRTDSVFALYRSGPAPATNQTSYYRVGTCLQDRFLNDVANFIDYMSDGVAATQEIYYRVSGEVQHNAPPPMTILCDGNQRLFGAGVPGEPYTIWPTLQRGPEDAPTFSEELKFTVPEIGGDITALAVMNDTLIVFKERAIYRVRGDGPSNTLATGQFLAPELISTEIGCVSQRSVLVTPIGTVFLSTRGFFRVTPDNQVSYMSPELEGLSGSDIPSLVANDLNGVVLLKFDQQIRWTSPTAIWVFDYFHGSWSIFDGQTVRGPSMDYQDRHVWPGSTTGEQESDSVVMVGIDMSFRTGKLKLPDEYICRFVGVTGDVTNSANMQINIYADDTDVPINVYSATLIAAGSLKTWDRVPADSAIMEMVEVEVTDFGTASPGALTIGEIILEVGARAKQAGVRR